MEFDENGLPPGFYARWRRRQWINFGVSCFFCAIGVPVLAPIVSIFFFNPLEPMDKLLAYVAAPIVFGTAGVLSIRRAMKYRL